MSATCDYLFHKSVRMREPHAKFVVYFLVIDGTNPNPNPARYAVLLATAGSEHIPLTKVIFWPLVLNAAAAITPREFLIMSTLDQVRIRELFVGVDVSNGDECVKAFAAFVTRTHVAINAI